MAEKMYYTMGEVSEMLDVTPSLIRFWEKRFDAIAPNKNKKGNRLFTAEDVRTLKTIYHLVKERGMTLAGAERQLKARRGATERDMELAERLGAIRALLVEVRGELGGGGVIVDDGAAEQILPATTAVEKPAAFEEPAIPAPAEEPVPVVFPPAPVEEPTPAEVSADAASAPVDRTIVSTASASAFAASEQEFTDTREQDDDEYDPNPEFAWETEPELQPEHKWEPEPEEELGDDGSGEEPGREPEKAPYPTELTLF